MNIFEILTGILIILSSIAIIVLVMLQDSTDGMSSAVTGDVSQSYFNNNRGRTREEKLKQATKIATIVLMIATVTVGVISRFVK